MEKEGILTLEELIRIDPDYEAEQNKEVINLGKSLNWKYSLRNLIVRVQKFVNSNFSVRETKLLKKLVKESDMKNIDYENILYNFPGKSIERIRSV